MQITSVRYALGLAVAALAITPVARGADAAATTMPPRVVMNNDQDRQNMMDQLHIKSLRNGSNGTNPEATNAANYTEEKANPYPKLPDALILKNGKPVTSAKMWWNQRRPEIAEDFDREVYGRVPKHMPKVTWECVSTNYGTNSGTNGDIKTFTRQFLGHVDNSSYTNLSVDIQLSLTLPVDAKGPSPVMMVFGGGFGGGRGGGRGGRGGAGGTNGPAAFGGGFGAFGGGPGGAGAGAGTNAFARGGAFGGGAFGGGPGGTNAGFGGGFGAFGAGPGGGTNAGFGGRGGRGGRGGGLGAGGFGGGINWQYVLLSQGWGTAQLNPNSFQADNTN